MRALQRVNSPKSKNTQDDCLYEKYSSTESFNDDESLADEQSKNPSSKYDFVKVRVNLNSEHYYTFSRSLLCRVLQSIGVKVIDAVKMALDLKKLLVDKGKLEITQKTLERELFSLVLQNGYPQRVLDLYKMIHALHIERIPFIVIVKALNELDSAGIYLCSRLNLTLLIQTKIVLSIVKDLKLESTATNDEQLVLAGIRNDIRKCFKEGKQCIIEGMHLDQSILKYIEEFVGSKGVVVPVAIGHSADGYYTVDGNQESTESLINAIHEHVLTELEKSFLCDFVFNK